MNQPYWPLTPAKLNAYFLSLNSFGSTLVPMVILCVKVLLGDPSPRAEIIATYHSSIGEEVG